MGVTEDVSRLVGGRPWAFRGAFAKLTCRDDDTKPTDYRGSG